jgi:hypothetical protein
MKDNFVKIPQYENTLWFNTIITAIIYSKYSRELLKKKGLLSKREEPFARLLNKLLIKDKDLKIDSHNFKLLKPSTEILKSIKMDPKINDYIYKYSWDSWMFFINFLKYIDVSYLSLDYYKSHLYFGLRDNLNFKIENDNIKYDVYEPFSDTYADKEYAKLKSNPNPNYLCINVWGKETYNNIYIKYLNIHLSKENVAHKLNLDTHKSIKYDGLKELREEIEFNNYRYKLDSVILDDYKDIGDNSDFGLAYRYGTAGITDENDVKYIYNAKARVITDSEHNLIYLNADKLLPCEYIEYKWDVRNYKRKLLLSKSLCKKEINSYSKGENDVYYFGRGIRTVVYVKQEKLEKSSNLSKKRRKDEIRDKKIKKNEIKKEINKLKDKIQDHKDKINHIKSEIKDKKKDLEKLKRH